MKREGEEEEKLIIIILLINFFFEYLGLDYILMIFFSDFFFPSIPLSKTQILTLHSLSGRIKIIKRTGTENVFLQKKNKIK